MIDKIIQYVVVFCAPLLLSSCSSSYSPGYDLNTSEEIPKEAAVSYLQKIEIPRNVYACVFQLNTMSAVTSKGRSKQLAYSSYSLDMWARSGQTYMVHIWQTNLAKHSYTSNACAIPVSNEKEIRNTVTALKSLGVKVP